MQYLELRSPQMQYLELRSPSTAIFRTENELGVTLK